MSIPGFPFLSNYFDTASGRCHFIDVAPADKKSFPVAVVFAHGTPSWSFEFREVISEISKSQRCIAMDWLGFGLSDHPENGDYRLTTLALHLEALLKSLGITRVHLVATDFGLAIALLALLKNPSQLASVTIMNSWAWPMELVDKGFRFQKPLINSGLMKWLYLKKNFSAKVILKSAWGKRRPLTPEIHQSYLDRFPTPQSRVSTFAFAQQLCDSRNPAWNQDLELLNAIPLQILWGTADKFIKRVHLDEWKRRFPKAKVHKLDEVGHFVCDEAAPAVVDGLKGFLGPTIA